MEIFKNAVFAFTCGRVKTEVFENADLAFTCGRVKTEVFENDDAIGACDCLDDLILLDNAHAPHRALSYFLRFCVYVWTGENDSNTLRVDTIFFQKRRKKTPFSKISAYVWTGPYTAYVTYYICAEGDILYGCRRRSTDPSSGRFRVSQYACQLV